MAGIIDCMRRVLSLFMVMLLALRGLAGDAMAMDNSLGHSPAHAVAAASALAAEHEMPAHAHHSQPTALGHDMAHAAQSLAAGVDNGEQPLCSDEASPAGDCSQHKAHCSSCGLCHTAMGQSSLAAASSFLPKAAQPRHQAAHFASAAPAQLVKPPIPAV